MDVEGEVEIDFLPKRDENIPVNCATCSSLGRHGATYLCRRLYTVVGQIHSPIKCYRWSKREEV